MPGVEGTITSSQVRKRKVDAEETLSGEEVSEKTVEEIRKDADKTVLEMAETQTDKILSRASGILLKMERANASWTTQSGVVFSKEHPFQLIPEDEMMELLNEGGFRRADPQEVVLFYKK